MKKSDYRGLPLDLVGDVARAMSLALSTHKAEVRAEGGDADYWRYVDANHRYLMAAAAIKALRGQPCVRCEAVEQLLRDVLEAVAQQQGVSLESQVNPGEPARNYELMDAIGIGHVLGMTHARGVE